MTGAEELHYSALTFTCPVCGRGTEAMGTDASARGSVDAFIAEHRAMHLTDAASWSAGELAIALDAAAQGELRASEAASLRGHKHDAATALDVARLLGRAAAMIRGRESVPLDVPTTDNSEGHHTAESSAASIADFHTTASIAAGLQPPSRREA